MNTEMVSRLVEVAKNAVPVGVTPDKWIEIYNQRLVELVMQECIDLVNKRKNAAIDADWIDVDEAMSNAVWDIEEHFGILSKENDNGEFL